MIASYDVLLPETLEIVWFASPRRIEEFSGVSFPYPYMRLEKSIGAMCLAAKQIHIPAKHFEIGITEYLLRQHASYLVQKLINYQERINSASNILFCAGAREIIFEFKVTSGRFSFIDWDTNVETFR